MVLESQDEVEDFYDHFTQHLRFIAFKAIDLWDTQAVVKLNQFSSTDDVRQHPIPLSNDQNTSKQVKSLVQIESPSPYLPNDTLAGRFRGEMDRVSIRGVNGNDEVVPYVPLSALEKYWTDERVIEVLNSRTINFPEGARFINQGYLRIFSTLVYSGFCDKISWFFYRNTLNVDDYDLPFDDNTFEHTSEWSSSFLEHQWMFCPVGFTDGYCHRQALDLRVILPVTYGEYIKAHRTGPDGAILRKVNFSFGSDSYLSMGKHVIFKVYEGHRGEARYNAETEGYQELQKLPNDFIAKYFASFHFPEANRFVIVLEYAEDGSLTDYLETTLPPTTPEDVLLLWKSMFSLTEALDALTVVYQQNPRSPTFVGVHQDINPGNILVFPRSKGSSLFDVSFKLKDFGMAGTGAMSVLDKMIRFGNRRNRDYVSPEVFNFAIQGTGITAISQLTDTWSFGTLFSDFLVWTMTGELGREAYRVKRNAEIPQIQQFPIAGYDCCFHDGKKRLKVIEDVHNEALECRRASDLISPAISDLILNHMLVESRDRLDAMQVRNYAANKLKEYQETLHGMLPTLEPADIDPPGPLHPHAEGIRANMQSLLSMYGHGGEVVEKNYLWLVLVPI
ncbi:hypothetical protein NW760_011876 [Fusarium oxysporum]|nr:hypothetical protein NW769_013318 [Fusarium oxysporum]KAJ4220709.1 hypothetical protein NW760_011876 [Fusarium oxysporum]